MGDGKDDELFVSYSVGDVVLAKTRGEVHAPDSALADVVEEGVDANGVTRLEVGLFEGEGEFGIDACIPLEAIVKLLLRGRVNSPVHGLQT